MWDVYSLFTKRQFSCYVKKGICLMVVKIKVCYVKKGICLMVVKIKVYDTETNDGTISWYHGYFSW